MVYKQTVEEFVADARTIASLGANIIGGCCGTTPEFIAGLRKEVGSATVAAEGREDAR